MNRLFLTLGTIIHFFQCVSQVNEGGLPVSFEYSKVNYLDDRFAILELQQPDLSSLAEKDRLKNSIKMENRIGVNIPLSFSFFEKASSVTLSDGNTLFRLGIRIPNAKAIGLYFSEAVNLPLGAKLFAYNENKKQILGAYTSDLDGFKAMEMVQGELLILEYFAPINATTPIIELKEAVYFYQGIENKVVQFSDNPLQSEKTGTCQVDISCSEGNAWQNQSQSVVFYTFSFDGFTSSCTGSMINNNAQNCKPYIYSAFHCGQFLANDDISQNVWYWKYEKTSCQTGNGNLTDPPFGNLTMTGGTVIASAGSGNLDNGYGMDGVVGSDFVLFELQSRPPPNYQAYLSGWNRTTNGSNSGATIHHPDGSAKKIATYNSSIEQDQFPLGTFWLIEWAQTSNGYSIPEGGSSGSPVYNGDFQIIGQISWALSSSCSNPQDQVAGAGMFSTSWQSNGSSPEDRLKPWLDPTNSGVNILLGRENNCPSANIVEVEMQTIKFFPNPSENSLNIEFGQSNMNEKYELLDQFGRIIIFGTINETTMILDIGELSCGTYFIKVNDVFTRFMKI